MKFLDYLSEAAEYSNDAEDLVKVIVPAIKNNNKLYNLPVIWRGWNAAKSIFVFGEITGATTRDFMRGMSGLPAQFKQKGSRDWVKDVVDALGFTPICCSYDYHQVGFFGNPCVVVPDTGFKIYQNPDVYDLATMNPSSKDMKGDGYTVRTTTFKYEDDEVESIVQGYKENYANIDAELLLKCDKYYVVNVKRMLWIARNSKFNKIRDIKELKTYSQVIDLIYNYRSYLAFIKKRREE